MGLFPMILGQGARRSETISDETCYLYRSTRLEPVQLGFFGSAVPSVESAGGASYRQRCALRLQYEHVPGIRVYKPWGCVNRAILYSFHV